jgi:hypothetical protein
VHNNNNNNHAFKIEERRREVASMLAQSMTETDMFFVSNCLNGIPKDDDNNNILKLIAV